MVLCDHRHCGNIKGIWNGGMSYEQKSYNCTDSGGNCGYMVNACVRASQRYIKLRKPGTGILQRECVYVILRGRRSLRNRRTLLRASHGRSFLRHGFLQRRHLVRRGLRQPFRPSSPWMLRILIWLKQKESGNRGNLSWYKIRQLPRFFMHKVPFLPNSM